MAEEAQRDLQRWMRNVPKGYVPVFYKSGEMVSLISEEELKRSFAPFIYSELVKIDDLIRRRVDQRISVLEQKMTVQRNLIGTILCTIILATSVILSSLSFLSFNIPGIGVTFLYGAVAALGGLVFIWYRERKERM